MNALDRFHAAFSRPTVAIPQTVEQHIARVVERQFLRHVRNHLAALPMNDLWLGLWIVDMDTARNMTRAMKKPSPANEH